MKLFTSELAQIFSVSSVLLMLDIHSPKWCGCQDTAAYTAPAYSKMKKGWCTADTDNKTSNVSSVDPSSERKRANARNVRLYYPYRCQYTNLFIFRFVQYLYTQPTQHTTFI